MTSIQYPAGTQIYLIETSGLVQESGCEVDHPSQSSAVAKNAWSFIFTPLHGMELQLFGIKCLVHSSHSIALKTLHSYRQRPIIAFIMQPHLNSGLLHTTPGIYFWPERIMHRKTLLTAITNILTHTFIYFK
jgi:hypothetical protein